MISRLIIVIAVGALFIGAIWVQHGIKRGKRVTISEAMPPHLGEHIDNPPRDYSRPRPFVIRERETMGA